MGLDLRPWVAPSGGEDAGGASQHPPVNKEKPLISIIQLLRPKSIVSDRFGGGVDLVCMVLACVSRWKEMSIATSIAYHMETVMASRDTAAFLRLLPRAFLWQCFMPATNRLTFGFFKARMTWKWRYKMTQLLHAKYFSKMNYYFIGEGGGTGGDKMSDADHRMVDDVKIAVQAIANTLGSTMWDTCQAFFYSVEVLKRYGLLPALSCMVYPVLSVYVVDSMTKVHKIWRVLGRNVGVTRAHYRETVTRVMLNSEAIAALKGVDYEREIMMSKFDTSLGALLAIHKSGYRYGTLNAFVSRFWGQFPSWYVLAPLAWSKPRPGTASVESIALERGSIGLQFSLYTRSMQLWNGLFGVYRALQMVGGNAERLTDLISLLETLSSRKQGEVAKNFKRDNRISFENVDIVTPKNVKLVNNLSFSVELGGSLLLTGHNGAGKSSIFRCLGGLWTVPTGTITKPGTAASGLHQEVFYLPQKPYQVLGTLVDQITYPETATDKSISSSDLAAILETFQLGYLLERDDVLTKEINWEEELSLGEKQRLAMARLMYQKPKFAILDECTSAVSTLMETTLYDIVEELNITYITISHRLTLRERHDQVLAIGDGKQGFTLSQTPRAPRAQRSADDTPRTRASKDTSEHTMRQYAAARSSPYVGMKRQANFRTTDTLQQLRKVLRLGFRSRWYFLYRFGWVMLTVAVQMYTLDQQLRVSSYMFGCAMARDKPGMLRCMAQLLACNLAASWNQEIQIWHARHVERHLIHNLTHNLMPRWTRANAFYRMNNIDSRISDADHRLVDDVCSFSGTIHSMMYSGGFLNPLVTLAWFTVRLGLFVGPRIPAALVLYNLVSFFILKTLMPDYKKIVANEQEAEGKFKFVHSRVKQHAESIAFFGGDAREKRLCQGRFVKVMELDWQRQWMDFWFQWIQRVFEGHIPGLLSWVIQFYFGKQFGGTDEDMVANKGAAMNSDQIFIMHSIGSVFGSLGQLLAWPERFAVLAGNVKRVAELDEVLNDLEQSVSTTASGNASVTACDPEKPRICFEGVDIVTPAGECCLSGLNFEIVHGRELMVTGANATGKSSLGRVLAGLWPLHAGSLVRPCGEDGLPGIADIFLVPQRVFMCTGSLADQCTYPLKLQPAPGAIPTPPPPKEGTPEAIWQPPLLDPVWPRLDILGFTVDPSHHQQLRQSTGQVSTGSTSHVRTQADEDKLMALLRLVGIEYLVERWEAEVDGDGSGWDFVTKWEDVLSLGEQQRMGMARLFYHAPRFGVLDECTSAVSVEVEEKLYEAAADQGISCLTFSQRLALDQFHAQELKLGAAVPSGWTQHDL